MNKEKKDIKNIEIDLSKENNGKNCLKVENPGNYNVSFLNPQNEANLDYSLDLLGYIVITIPEGIKTLNLNFLDSTETGNFRYFIDLPSTIEFVTVNDSPKIVTKENEEDFRENQYEGTICGLKFIFFISNKSPYYQTKRYYTIIRHFRHLFIEKEQCNMKGISYHFDEDNFPILEIGKEFHTRVLKSIKYAPYYQPLTKDQESLVRVGFDLLEFVNSIIEVNRLKNYLPLRNNDTRGESDGKYDFNTVSLSFDFSGNLNLTRYQEMPIHIKNLYLGPNVNRLSKMGKYGFMINGNYYISKDNKKYYTNFYHTCICEGNKILHTSKNFGKDYTDKDKASGKIIPLNVDTIGKHAFVKTHLKYFIIDNQIQAIEPQAFNKGYVSKLILDNPGVCITDDMLFEFTVRKALPLHMDNYHIHSVALAKGILLEMHDAIKRKLVTYDTYEKLVKNMNIDTFSELIKEDRFMDMMLSKFKPTGAQRGCIITILNERKEYNRITTLLEKNVIDDMQEVNDGLSLDDDGLEK